MTSELVVVLAAFVAMEPVTALVHRLVMHGRGWVLHRSHHQRRGRGLEANDWFPVSFAAVVVTGMGAGFNVDGLGALVPAGIGVTLYGAAYGFVHDVYIHRRLPFRWRIGPLERLREAHRLHHLWNGEPFGMLVPIVPAALRRRAHARATRSAGDQATREITFSP